MMSSMNTKKPQQQSGAAAAKKRSLLDDFSEMEEIQKETADALMLSKQRGFEDDSSYMNSSVIDNESIISGSSSAVN